MTFFYQSERTLCVTLPRPRAVELAKILVGIGNPFNTMKQTMKLRLELSYQQMLNDKFRYFFFGGRGHVH